MITRRGILGGMISFIAAPAIVRASSLMPVKAFRPDPLVMGVRFWSWRAHSVPRPMYFGEGSIATNNGVPQPLSHWVKSLDRYREIYPDLTWEPIPAAHTMAIRPKTLINYDILDV